MSIRYDGKVAIVTGAGQGIGQGDGIPRRSAGEADIVAMNCVWAGRTENAWI